MKRIIIFLIRKKLKIKKYKHFQFTNQSSAYDTYYFTNTKLMKVMLNGRMVVESGVSLNWLLNEECTIKEVKR